MVDIHDPTVVVVAGQIRPADPEFKGQRRVVGGKPACPLAEPAPILRRSGTSAQT
jgi:hypothetical protein